MNRRLADECAFLLARDLVALIAHNYRDEELRDLFEAFHAACRDGLLGYAVRAERLEHRLRPLDN